MWCWSLLYTIWIVSHIDQHCHPTNRIVVSSCGSIGVYCALQKSAGDIQPASLEGEFKGHATYYNETKVGSQYSTCGIERSLSLDEETEKVYVAALNQVQFDPYTVNGIPSTNPICQKKALVKGPNGQIKVRFLDRCPDCVEGKSIYFRSIDSSCLSPSLQVILL